MIVYIYDKKTHKKLASIRNVARVESNKKEFYILQGEEIITAPKQGIKLVVYGF